jgi:hypothetical protein
MFVSHGLGSLIVLFGRLGHVQAAATLNGVAAKTFESNPFVPALAQTIGGLRRTLGDAAFDAAARKGAAMAVHEAYEYAIERVVHALREHASGHKGRVTTK